VEELFFSGQKVEAITDVTINEVCLAAYDQLVNVEVSI
jgi:hypothetical protein